MAKSKMGTAVGTQAAIKQAVDVGPAFGQVSTVAYWYRAGHFRDNGEAQGAFKLAYQQGLDGMGRDIAAWMGLTEAEYDAWSRRGTLPTR